MAAFLGLLWPRLRDRESMGLAVGCALVTLVAVPITPPGTPLPVAALVAIGTYWWQRDRQGWTYWVGSCWPAQSPSPPNWSVTCCPTRLLAAPWHQQASTAMTIGLLAALVATNAVASGQRLVLDSQVLSLVAAALALRLRAPYPAGGQHRSPRCRVGTPGRIALTQPGVEPPARRAWRPTRRTKSNTPVPLGIRYPPPRPVVRPASTL